MSYSFEEFCRGHGANWENLPATAQEFLESLSLPTIHPFCENQGLIYPNAPPMGPPSVPIHPVEFLVTLWYFYVPPIIALIDLWIRLLSGWIAPLGFIYLFWQNFTFRNQHLIPFCITVGTSWIMMTDDQYVIQSGRLVGFFLIMGTLLVSHKILSFPHSIYVFVILFALYPIQMDDPEEIVSPKPGLYYNRNNPMIQRIAQTFDRTLPMYSDIATKWQLTGDTRTGLPYLMNKIGQLPKFHRVWMPTVDDEYVALDIAFPEAGHDPSHPVYLIFHGLNGGSKEGYVLDLTSSRIKQGSTVVVMIARGLMDTPIQGWSIYNGARIIDAHSAAKILKERVIQPNQTLAGVGYSLGGIVLNNYVATYGKKVALDVSVSISGALFCPVQKDYHRSQITWQPMLAATMKQNYLDKKWGRRLHFRLGNDNYRALMRTTSVVDIDRYVGVQYGGYSDLFDFYTAMSAIHPNNPSLKQIAIPHLVLQSFDDPISTWRNNASNDPESPLYPPTLVSKVQKNLVLLLTKTGGHVGWPIGWWPQSWEYMNGNVAVGFIEAYENSKGHSLTPDKKIQEMQEMQEKRNFETKRCLGRTHTWSTTGTMASFNFHNSERSNSNA